MLLCYRILPKAQYHLRRVRRERIRRPVTHRYVAFFRSSDSENKQPESTMIVAISRPSQREDVPKGVVVVKAEGKPAFYIITTTIGENRYWSVPMFDARLEEKTRNRVEGRTNIRLCDS